MEGAVHAGSRSVSSRGTGPHGNLAVSICLQESTLDRAGNEAVSQILFHQEDALCRRLTSTAPSIRAAAELENSLTESPQEIWAVLS